MAQLSFDAALAVLKEFLHNTVDQVDEKKAAACLTKKSRESGSFNPQGPQGSGYEIGTPTRDGEAVVIPTKMIPPKGSNDPAMEIPVTVVLEDGQAKIDLLTTMDKLFGGSVQGALEQIGNAMGEAMGKAFEGIGEAMQQAFSGAGGGEGANQLAGGSDEARALYDEWAATAVLNFMEDVQRRTDGWQFTLDIDHASLLKYADADENRRVLDRVGGDTFRTLAYVLGETHRKFPLDSRVAIVRLEAAEGPHERVIWAENGKIVYRFDPLSDGGYYDVSDMERIIPGVVAGMPEQIDPRHEPRAGPADWLAMDTEGLIANYRDNVYQGFGDRISHLAGGGVKVLIEFEEVSADRDMARGLYWWGMHRIAGGIALLASDEETNNILSGRISEVTLRRVDGGERAISFENGALTVAVGMNRGDKGAFYEWEIAEAISKGLQMREGPAVARLKHEAEEWEARLEEITEHAVRYDIDFAGFCSREPERNMFALQLLREHGIDAFYYAVSNLAEKNPNFKQQFTQRVDTLRIVHVPDAGQKAVESDGSALVLKLFLHEGYKGYLTGKEIEKALPKLVAEMTDIYAVATKAERAELDEMAALEDESDRGLVEAEEDPEETEAEQKRSAFKQIREQIEQTLPVYAQQMLAMVGKAIAIEMEWESLEETDVESIGLLLNAGLAPVLGGISMLGQDPAMKAAITGAVRRVLLRRVHDATEQGFTLEGSVLVYSAIPTPGLPPMDPQLAATLLRNLFSGGGRGKGEKTPAKPQAKSVKLAAKKPAPKAAAKKPAKKPPAKKKKG